MKITVSRGSLAEELRPLVRISGGNRSIDIAKHVLLEAKSGQLQMRATDFDLSLRTDCGTEEHAEDGTIAVPAKKLHEIVAAISDEFVILETKKNGQVEIRGGRAKFNLVGIAGNEFPALPAEAPRRAEIPAAVFLDLIARTSFAMCEETARYYMAGALLVLDPAYVAMVATDGHRLSYARCDNGEILAATGVTEHHEVLIPKKAVQELATFIGEDPVVFGEADHYLTFRFGHRLLTTKKPSGAFPDYQHVMDKTGVGPRVATLDTEQFRAALSRVGLMVSGETRDVDAEFSEGLLTLHARSAEFGAGVEEVAAEWQGAPEKVGFRMQYVGDWLKAVGTAKVRVTLTGEGMPIVLFPEGETGVRHQYLVMPLARTAIAA